MRVVWDYMCLRHDLSPFDPLLGGAPADAIVCLGSSDLRAATHAAALFRRGLAPYVVCTGGHGTGMHSGGNLLGWAEPEAVVFARECTRCGVPAERVLVEPLAANTGENIRFAHALLGATPGVASPLRSLILVAKPFMGRRAFATFLQQWPRGGGARGGGGGGGADGGDATSPPLPPDEVAQEVAAPAVRIACSSDLGGGWPGYLVGSGLRRRDVVGILVGDLQRVWLYAEPRPGGGEPFQAPQHVPPAVRAAFDTLAPTYPTNLAEPLPLGLPAASKA